MSRVTCVLQWQDRCYDSCGHKQFLNYGKININTSGRSLEERQRVYRPFALGDFRTLNLVIHSYISVPYILIMQKKCDQIQNDNRHIFFLHTKITTSLSLTSLEDFQIRPRSIQNNSKGKLHITNKKH